MNQDDILRAAIEAGFIGMNAGSDTVLGIPMSTGDTLVSLLGRFAQAIEAQVREECANECEQDVGHKYSATASILGYGNFFAALIRNKPCA